MATPEPVEPSRRLRQAAKAERDRLVRDRDHVSREAETLRRRLADVEKRVVEIEQHLALVQQLAGEREPLAREAPENVVSFPDNGSEPLNGYLRGATIRTIAVRVLVDEAEPDAFVHYTDWYRLVLEAGFGISGKDPLASFLTQVARSPVVVRGKRPGTYRIDRGVPGTLRRRLDELNSELLSLHHGQQTIEEITSSRERRAQLISQISRAERDLEEALEGLGIQAPPR